MPVQGIHLKFEASRKANINNNIVASLKWAARRIGPATAAFKMYFRTFEGISPDPANNELGLALASSPEGLRHLRLLACHIFSLNDDQTAIATFQEWLLQHVPRLEALSIWLPRLRLADLSFQHLRHCHLRSHSFDSLSFRAAEHLPALESLSLEAPAVASIDELGMAGCKHLRLLAVQKVEVRELSLDPTCRFRCLLGDLTADPAFWSGPMRGPLAAADQISLYCEENFVEHTHGLFGNLPCMEMLKLSWPVCLATGLNEDEEEEIVLVEDGFSEGAELLLMNCMPVEGQPLQNLKSIIISGWNIRTTIPSGLPCLEELVILAERQLVLSFQDTQAAAASLEKLYLFGQPLVTNGVDVAKISCGLVNRDPAKVLDATAAQNPPEGETAYRTNSSCLYLRPILASVLSIQELYTIAKSLTTKCRCGCCASCLNSKGWE